MKHFYATILCVVFLSSSAYSQVGINTTSPGGILDVQSTTMGVVYPVVSLSSTSTETITNPNGPNIVAGTTIYNNATAGSGITAVFPGIYTWDGTEWTPQFHKRDYQICSQDTDLRTGSNDGTYGNQAISFDTNSFTAKYDGEYLITLTAHFGGGAMDPPNNGNDQHVNYNSQGGEYDFTFNGTTHTFTLKSFSGINDDRLFDGGSINNHYNQYNQATYTVAETLTRATAYPFTLTFNQTTSNGFQQDGDFLNVANDGTGYIIINNSLHCTVEFKYVGN